MDPVLGLALPAGAIVFALLGYALHKASVWRFDRKHPGLSRNGMRAVAEDRAARAQPSLPPALGAWVPSRSADMVRSESKTFDIRRRRYVAGEGEATTTASSGEEIAAQSLDS